MQYAEIYAGVLNIPVSAIRSESKFRFSVTESCKSDV
jgi:hypothetical protein